MFKKQFSHRFHSQSRPPQRGRQQTGKKTIKTVSKDELLALIAQSKKAQAADAPTLEVVPITHTFADFHFSDKLYANIISRGYTSPTPIQDQSIPAILDGRDIIGTAQTGTGKTGAFLLPIMERMLHNPEIRALIVAPTRELAFQINAELRAFGKGLPVRSAVLIGGASEWQQQQELRRNPNIIIATPGRLRDFIRSSYVSLSKFDVVVLDEADRMVDIGFITDIKYFISLLPKERQSLFFSATISGKVREILAEFVRNPVRVSVQTQDTAETVEQEVISVPKDKTKIDVLHDLLIQDGFTKVLVFGRTKWGIERLARELSQRGFSVDAIHGNKRQNQRQRTLAQFTNNRIQVLLATDVASRGLDIPDVTHVINFDLPETLEDYIHRIGRTGRAQKRGIALTFL